MHERPKPYRVELNGRYGYIAKPIGQSSYRVRLDDGTTMVVRYDEIHAAGWDREALHTLGPIEGS